MACFPVRGVFPMGGRRTPPLPYDAEVEYIEINGDGAFINTGVVPVDNPSATLRAQYLGTSAGSAQTTPLFGCRNYSNPSKLFAFWVRSDTLKLAVNYGTVDTGWQNQTTDKTAFHDFGLSASGGTYDGTTFVSHGQTLGSNMAIACYVGAVDQTGGNDPLVTRQVKLRIASFRLYNGGVLAFDGIAVRSGTTGEMYDRVSGALATRVGTFVVGPDK